MSRVIKTTNFTGQSSNFSVMYEKHTTDDKNSVLNHFLEENEIDLTADQLLEVSALLHERNRQHILDIQGKQQQLVVNYLSIPWKEMLGAAQYLKKYYKDNVRSLVEWSIPITAAGKIKYPTDEAKKLELVDGFWSYHGSLPVGTSPLDEFIAAGSIDVAKIIGNIASAKTTFAALSQSIITEQQETGERDRIWAPVWEHTKSIGAFLMKMYVSNPKMVCNWGYNVVDASSKQSLRTTKLIIGAKLSVNNVVPGSTLSNLGTGELHVYKGKTTTGTPIVVKAGEHLGMLKGFSMITVVNPSIEVAGKFSTLVNR